MLSMLPNHSTGYKSLFFLILVKQTPIHNLKTGNNILENILHITDPRCRINPTQHSSSIRIMYGFHVFWFADGGVDTNHNIGILLRKTKHHEQYNNVL